MRQNQTLDTDELAEIAEAVLTYPDSFMSSDPNICTTHGLMFGQHRDSDALSRSNWEVISKDLMERFGSLRRDSGPDVYVFSASHWAVGWVDQLAVRVYRYPHPLVRTYTPAFIAAVEWKANLDEYPVADEMHFSELEMDDALETLTNCYDVSSTDAERVFSYLFDAYSYSSAEEYSYDDVAEAVAAIHADCQECRELPAYMIHVRQLAYGTQKEALCVPCYVTATSHTPSRWTA